MNLSYTLNYFKIYFWQGISIVLNLSSMFIVIPKLSDEPTIYGIYFICIFTTIFLTYADFGFVGAGYKYASEYYAKQNLKDEIKIEGFTIFILAIITILITIIFFILANKPQILIKNLTNSTEILIASKLLFILAIFAPVTILQRLLQIIFGIRLENYIYQKILIISSLLKIVSIFYFFFNGKYNIVGYYLFFQVMNFIATIASCIIVRNRYKYDYKFFLKNLKFSKELYIKTKKLAFGTLFVTVMWILYYELDSYTIVKLIGAKTVAFYAIGLTMLSFFRTIFGVLYGPFSARFNHFIGLQDKNGLKIFFYSTVILTMPLVVFPILNIVILMKPIVFCWVGYKYGMSVIVAQFLILSFIYSFISYPTANLIVAKERIKLLYIPNLIMVIIYWGGIFLTFSNFKLMSFAIFKFIIFTFSGIFYFFVALKFLKLQLWEFVKKAIVPIMIPVSFLVLSSLYIKQFMPETKSKINLLTVIISGTGISLIALYLYYLFSPYFKNYVNGIFKKIILKKS